MAEIKQKSKMVGPVLKNSSSGAKNKQSFA